MHCILRQLHQTFRIVLRKPIYFDNNATTQLDPVVSKFTSAIQQKSYGNPSSLHLFGIKAREIVEKARHHVATILNAEPDEIIFTGSGTEANNTIIKSVAATHPGGHFITSAIEHPSALKVFQSLEKQAYTVTYLGIDSAGRIQIEELKKGIRPETALISIMHVNNEIGTIQPIEEIGTIAHSHNIPFHSDIVQSFSKIPLNVQLLPVDFLSISAHKIYGPKGIGAIYKRKGTTLAPLLEGGHQEHLLRAGTEALINIAGFGEASRLMNLMDSANYLARLARIKKILIDGMKEIFSNMKINGDIAFALPTTLNVTLPGIPNSEILAYLDFYKIAVSVGSACVAGSDDLSHVLIALGLTSDEIKSSFRLSFGKFNSEAEAWSFLKILKKFSRERKEFFAYILPGDLLPEDCEQSKKIVVDIRDEDQRNKYPIFSTALRFDRTMKELKTLPKDKEVVLLCEDGYLSNLYTTRLRNAGWKNVKSLMGGYKSWRQYHRDYYYYNIVKGTH